MSKLKAIISALKNPHFQSLLGNGVVSVFGMVTLAVLYRALTVQDIGVYIFFITILGLVDTVRSGFLTTSFITFYSGTERTRANEVAGSTWMIALIVTIACVVINIPTYFLAPYVKNEGMNLFMKYFSLISIITLPAFMASLVIQGEKRFDRLLRLRLISQGLFTGAAMTLALLNKANLTTIILAYIATNTLSSIIALLVGWTMLSKLRNSTKKTCLELFHFGKYSFGTSISANLFQVTDTFFINFFLGPAAIAVYNLGGKLLQIIEIPLLSIASSGMPVLSSHYNNNKREEMMYTMKKMAGMLSIAIICAAIGALIFAEPIIQLIGGAKYLDTAAPNLFRIFMCIAILYPIDRFFAITLDVVHLPKVNFYKILIMLFVNLIGDYFSLSIFKSVYAITIASLFPTLVAIFVTYPPLNKFSKFNYWSIYSIGYKESILFVKQIYQTLFLKKQSNNSI
ncbi:oligosaccharide flippase family protein [Pedobacter sp. MC2016-14]|uniref:oligosaccharide flippase family protein n=1 Tax=Pedobacter sp. MC2016-14 TaxID=2897327 RepID=UPI001E3E066D|nr:oligosaccharide flippase family protein [Pedobacter sp. MC2016-14]MCD0490213.1 oligosaccharide flippase family protein [Pedobacter sp. MC2016-14]